jgi:hypothetical protein
MKPTFTKDIYSNPLPQLKSRQAMFPSLCELDDGKIAASIIIGEAFESVDSRAYILFSEDGGKSFSEPRLMLCINEPYPINDYAKLSRTKDGLLIAYGYGFIRNNPSLPIGNPENGGFFVNQTKDMKAGTYLVSIRCVSDGVTYDNPDILTVKLSKVK